MELTREGRVWKFVDNINTDLIFPNRAFRLAEQEQHTLVFTANRPGWVNQVQMGDILIGGRNFGMGSGRPVGKLLHACGIRGLVAETINGLCFRNCITYSFPALTCQGVTELFHEGDVAHINYASGLVANVTTGATLQGTALPPLLLEIVLSGGVIEMLVRDGYIEPTPTVVKG